MIADALRLRLALLGCVLAGGVAVLQTIRLQAAQLQLANRETAAATARAEVAEQVIERDTGALEVARETTEQGRDASAVIRTETKERQARAHIEPPTLPVDCPRALPVRVRDALADAAAAADGELRAGRD